MRMGRQATLSVRIALLIVESKLHSAEPIMMISLTPLDVTL